MVSVSDKAIYKVKAITNIVEAKKIHKAFPQKTSEVKQTELQGVKVSRNILLANKIQVGEGNVCSMKR